MSRSAFAYVIYIGAAPERVWQALTDNEFIPRYWYGMTCECEWKLFSPWKLVFADGRVADKGEILEVDPPRKLVIKWMNEFRPELAAEGPARCTYTLAAEGKATKLTILH